MKAADVVILAVPFTAVDSVIAEVGDALAGKVLIDVTNRMKREAIAESVDGSSASEQIQHLARIAKISSTGVIECEDFPRDRGNHVGY